MNISIVQSGRVLRQHLHKGETFVEAPPEGDYVIRLHNNHHKRREAVVSVDGINVIDGKDAGFSGTGYIIGPWQTVDIPGWRRDDKKVAAFKFDERVEVQVPVLSNVEHHYHYSGFRSPWYSFWGGFGNTGPFNPAPSGGTYCSTLGAELGAQASASFSGSTVVTNNSSIPSTKSVSTKSLKSPSVTRSVKDVGTAYGQETSFFTTTVDFARATSAPMLVAELRYATRERLKSWGVKLDQENTPFARPSAFPASQGCPAPAGWSPR